MTSEKSFPVALHNYFRILNISQERNKFLESPDYIPKFIYPSHFNEKDILSRQSLVGFDSKEHHSLSYIYSGARLQSRDNELESFRDNNRALFGEPSELYVKELIIWILGTSKYKEGLEYNYIINTLNIKTLSLPSSDIRPAHGIFAWYKKHFEKYHERSTDYGYDVILAINSELEKSGLSKNGWKLQVVDGESHARTSHANKKIKIGKLYYPRTTISAERIAIHEVYGHALCGPRSSIMTSEGFALVLEQLLDDRFKFRRSYRYIAACLGWGAYGDPMNFRSVFEIIWRLMVLAGAYKERNAKKYAFNECCRVFRGGRNDIAGAVCLKDMIYFKSNIDIWAMLSSRKMNYNEFIDIIEGRAEIRL